MDCTVYSNENNFFLGGTGGTDMLLRCTKGDFYVALGCSMGLALLVWVGVGLYMLQCG